VDQQNRVQWIYTSRDNEELRDRYDQWAKEYDEDLEKNHDYQAPKVTAGYFTRYVPMGARILDVGTGTGLMGEVLANLGYDNQIAMDLSQGMLDIAQQKNVYQELHQMVLGETLDFPTDSFDAAVSTGVFTQAHAPASSFEEIVRIVKPAGYIIFTLSTDSYKNAGFKEKFTPSNLKVNGNLLRAVGNKN
jgi:predicted TPR repeat methyltransferase